MTRDSSVLSLSSPQATPRTGLGTLWGRRRPPAGGGSSHLNRLSQDLHERDWGQEEKGMTEDEMAGWRHQYDGHEFE